MIVLLSDDAELDLVRGVTFYDSAGKAVGEHFLDSLITDLQSLSFSGGVHGKRFGYHCMCASRFPFAIYYTVEGDSVIVIAILDERRNPDLIADRLNNG